MRYFVPGSAPFVVSKVLADTLVFGPVHVCLYFAFTKLLEKGADPGDIVAKIKKDFIAAYVAEFALWTPVQLINFSFVPVKHHLLVVNAASIIDSCFLSWVGHHKDWVEALKSVVLGEPESDKQELSGCN